MPDNFDPASFSEEDNLLAQSRGPIGNVQDAAKGNEWFSLTDVAAAPFRGAVDAVHGVYGLVDSLTGDALPDWENPLGKSHTIIGSALEGITQFAAGFIPFGGGLGFAGLIPELAEGAGLAANIARTAAATGASAFAVFNGHDKRLSDLISSVPALKNPVTDFLKSNDDDPEIVGRLKNALEQAGLAAALEPLFYGLKSYRAAQRAASGKDATAEAVDAAAAQHAEEIKGALARSDSNQPLPSALETIANRARDMLESGGAERKKVVDAYLNWNPSMRELTMENVGKQSGLGGALEMKLEDPAFIRHLAKNLGQELPEEAGAVAAQAADIVPPTAAVAPSTTTAPSIQESAMTRLGVPSVKVKALIERMGEKEANAPHLFTPEGAEMGPNPRTLTETDRLLGGIDSKDLNLSPFKNKDGVPVLLSTVEEMIAPAVMKDIKALRPQDLAQMDRESFAALGDIVDGDGARFNDQIMRGIYGPEGDLEVLGKRLTRLRSYKWLMDQTAKQNVEHLGFVKGLYDRAPGVAGNLDLELVRADYNLRYFAALQSGVKGLYSMVGRTLRGAADISDGLSIGEFLSRSAKGSGMADRLPQWDAALGSNPRALEAQVNALGGRDFLTAQMEKARIAYADGNTAGLAKIVRQSTGVRVAAMTREFWMSALLGSPKTILVNILSQSANNVYGPYEKMIGAQLVKASRNLPGPLNLVQRGALEAAPESLLRTPAAQLAAQDSVLRAATNQADEIIHSGREFLNIANAARQGEEVGLRGSANAVVDKGMRLPAITAEAAGLDPESVAGKMVDWMGKWIRLPTKILGESDKVISQVSARSYARSWLREEALSKGLTEPGVQSQYVVERMQQLIDGNQFKTVDGVMAQAANEARNGGLTDPSAIADYQSAYMAKNFPEDAQALADKSIAYARDRGFTTPAAPGTLSWHLQRMVASHPYLSLVTPFINTPVNLLKWTGQRLDAYGLASYVTGRKLGFLERSTMGADGVIASTKNRFLREMLSGDPEAKANAVGRLATGAGLASMAASLAYSGVITGRGPSDPKERQAWLQAGNLPYSIKTPRGQIQFNRLDPAATMFGLAADVADTARHATEEDQPLITGLMHGLMVAFANNITQKSYLAGVQKFAELATDPEKNIGKFAQGMAGSFVPNYLNAAVGPAGDEYTHEIGSMIDAVQARLPGLSTSLPPQRNILGEPIKRTTALGSDAIRWNDFVLPVAFKATSDDAITNELGRLAYPFSSLSKTVNGQDLTQVPAGDTNAHDRWGELIGTVRVGGDTIRERLKKLLGSRDYQKLEPDIVDGKLSPRADLINRVVHDYRAAAFEKLQAENPRLKSYNQTFVANRQRLRHGLAPSILPTVTD